MALTYDASKKTWDNTPAALQDTNLVTGKTIYQIVQNLGVIKGHDFGYIVLGYSNEKPYYKTVSRATNYLYADGTFYGPSANKVNEIYIDKNTEKPTNVQL